jgi:glycosyltransferase involved in cell wall biosynthesis
VASTFSTAPVVPRGEPARQGATAADKLRVTLVGPVPPPAGGTLQLERLLHAAGVPVELIAVNAPYRPRWVGRLRGLRALTRLVAYLLTLRRAFRAGGLVHVMANSGWAWHLFAAPAIALASLAGLPVVVNYRGGEAERFLARSARWVLPVLRRAHVVAVPSQFLVRVFARHGVETEVVPNIVDTDLFRFTAVRDDAMNAPRLLITRNLERLYDIATALHAFRIVVDTCAGATLVVAGTGPEEQHLRALVRKLGLEGRVSFPGRLDRGAVAAAYAEADVLLNPSRVDNMPNSLLEAMACGVPVVSTDVGGVPFIIEHARTGLLVPPGDAHAMARQILEVLRDTALARRLSGAARESVEAFTWPRVRARWLAVYVQAVARRDDARGLAATPGA